MAIPRKLYAGALIGIFLEYFDYTLYGFSAVFIAHLFFPEKNSNMALIFTWGIFAISFLLRPFGALLFGHLADRLGRRPTLLFTIIIMNFATIAIGLLPTYQSVGFWAPVGLIVCRMLQGLAVSTQYSGGATYVLEFKTKHQGLTSGIVTSASGIGVFAASLLVLLFNTVHFSFISMSTWRVPFIIAGIIGGVLGIYLRHNLSESPAFLEIQCQNKIVKLPFWKLLQKNPKAFFTGIIISAYVGIAIIVIEIYLPSYLQTYLAIPRETALRLSTYTALIEAFFAIGWGYIADFLGFTQTLFLGGVLMLLIVFPSFHLLHHFSSIYFLISMTLLALAVGAVDGPIAAYLANSFPTAIRYTGVSLTYSLGAATVGGLSPSFLEFLHSKFSIANLLAWYIAISASIMLVTLLLIKVNKNHLFHL